MRNEEFHRTITFRISNFGFRIYHPTVAPSDRRTHRKPQITLMNADASLRRKKTQRRKDAKAQSYFPGLHGAAAEDSDQ